MEQCKDEYVGFQRAKVRFERLVVLCAVCLPGLLTQMAVGYKQIVALVERVVQLVRYVAM